MRSHIHSVWQLELLLFFKNQGAGISIPDVSRANYLDDMMAESAIRALVDANLLAETRNGLYNYTASIEKSKLVDELASAYANRRAAVIQFIYSSYV